MSGSGKRILRPKPKPSFSRSLEVPSTKPTTGTRISMSPSQKRPSGSGHLNEKAVAKISKEMEAKRLKLTDEKLKGDLKENKLLDKLLLEELTCPSCYNYMCPPIKQCQNGHNICSECFPKVTVCPKCRSPKSTTSRNYSLESIHGKFKIPCKNQDLGCKFVCLGESITKHQKYCLYTKKHCPFAQFTVCPWKDSMTKLIPHLQKKHAHEYTQQESKGFKWRDFWINTNNDYMISVINVYDGLFRVTSMIKKCASSVITLWAVYYLGSPEDATKFFYKLEFIKAHHIVPSGVPLTFKSVCAAAPEKNDAKFGDHDFFYIHKKLLDGYCSESGSLHFRVSINVADEDEGLV